MKILYADDKIELGEFHEHSIFLAGPTPRSADTKSWRPEALSILEDLDYNGLVWVPEREDWGSMNYIDQVLWEKFGLESSTKIVFWVPRKIPEMSAYTTNVEFGRYVGSGRAVYGRPNDAEKCDYLDWMYTDITGETPHTDLRRLLEVAIG